MAKQLFLNNFISTFVSTVLAAPSTGSPATEVGYGILQLNTGAAGLLLNPTGGDYYVLTAFKKSGSVESAIEIMKVTAVDNSVLGECRITVNRAQEGTTAQTYIAGDFIALRLTKDGAAGFAQTANNLSDISSAATARANLGLGNVDNVSAANLRDRTTHTGMQLAATISDFAAAVRATALTGIDLTTNTAVTAADTVLSAIGKLWAKVVAHLADTGNPHAVTKAQIGLGSVDNTADAIKAVLSATKLATARNIDGQPFDGTGNITVIAPGIHNATSKAAPVDDDELSLVDSAAANTLKKLTWANLKANIFATVARNRIINGAMTIDQRNSGASVTPGAGGGQYTLDRWFLGVSQASKLSIQQVFDAPAGAKNSAKVSVVSQFNPGASDKFSIFQAIEGNNIIDFAFGTSNAISITTSFYVKTSVTGTYAIAITNGARTYIATYTISAANTWSQLVIVIDGDQSGTWITDTTAGLFLIFDLGAGSSFVASSANVWSAGSFRRVAGCVNFVNQPNGSTWQVTNVQVQAAAMMNPVFDNLDFGTELALCKRYYERRSIANTNVIGSGYAVNATSANIVVPIHPKRAAPTASFSGNLAVLQSGGATNITAMNSSIYVPNANEIFMQFAVASGLVAGNGAALFANGGAAVLEVFSEL